jgi:phosphoglycolate phosphatase-like HAD superfamily hydrolase
MIFDLDGTLVDSRLDFEAIRRDMGLPARTPILEALAQFSPGPELDRMQAVLRDHELRSAERATLFDGVLEFLAWIDAQSWPRAILTRNSRECTDIVMDRLQLQFTHVLTREDAPPKPDPAGLLRICEHWQIPAEFVGFCGDYVFDLQAGRCAGMKTILFAPGELPEFADQADLILRDFHSAGGQLRRHFAKESFR